MGWAGGSRRAGRETRSGNASEINSSARQHAAVNSGRAKRPLYPRANHRLSASLFTAFHPYHFAEGVPPPESSPDSPPLWGTSSHRLEWWRYSIQPRTLDHASKTGVAERRRHQGLETPNRAIGSLPDRQHAGGDHGAFKNAEIADWVGRFLLPAGGRPVPTLPLWRTPVFGASNRQIRKTGPGPFGVAANGEYL